MFHFLSVWDQALGFGLLLIIFTAGMGVGFYLAPRPQTRGSNGRFLKRHD